MKRLEFILLAVMCISAAGCSGVEDKSAAYAQEMVEAIKAKDFDKAGKIQEEYDKWYESLSDEDRVRAGAAVADVAKDIISNNLKED